jgi:chemotaxis protein CheD
MIVFWSRPTGADVPHCRVVVGVGEFAVSDAAEETIVTHALGSCVAVCLWDPIAQVAGLLHFLLPDSRINPDRARAQPGAFADTGISAMLAAAMPLGLSPARCRVRLVGGAEVNTAPGGLHVGLSNVVAAQGVLWRQGARVHRYSVGGNAVRTVSLAVADGELLVTECGDHPAIATPAPEWDASRELL